VKYRAAREERKQRAARGRKNPDIWWREEVLLGVLLIERSLCLRAFSPSNFPSEGIFIGLFFRQFFFFLVGKPSFSLIFFSVVSERRERRGGKINTKNHYGASTSSVDDSLYVILFFRRKEE